MQPTSRRRVLAAAGVLVACAIIGVLAGVLTKVALDNRQQHRRAIEQAAPPAAPAAALAEAPLPPPPSAASSLATAQPPGAGDGNGTSLEVDSKAPFYAENQQPEESVFLVLGPDALVVAAQSGEMPLPYASWGPCRSLRSVTNISLDLSAAATGCRGAQCAINLRVTMPAPGSCAAFPGPLPTVYFISGFSCLPTMYKSFADRLATWGYAVLQYDRPLGGLFTPTSETESSYFTQIMTWRNRVNNTRSSSGFAGQFSAAPVGVIGHSMGGGLAAILAGMHPSGVGAAVLLDPVDYSQMSLRVARQFLAEYRQPVCVMTTGVKCVDRNGCIPPQGHTPSAAEEAAWAAQGRCRPSWWCCDWDDYTPGLETKSPGQMALHTDGPSGFVEFASPGSWLARFGLAGHMSFMEPGSTGLAGISCPAVAENSAVQPDALALATAFLAARLRGEAGAEELTLAWAERSRPPQDLFLGIKEAPPS